MSGVFYLEGDLMGCPDCCSSIASCDCCTIVGDCDCCSVDCSCCPDCYGAGGLFGGLKFGDGIFLDGDTLSVTLEPYVLPTASKTVKGGVKIGDGLKMNGETLNVTLEPYTLPTASETLKGGIKVGHSLLMTKESLNVALDTVSSTVEGFMWIYDTP